MRERIDEIYAEHTGKPTEEVRQDMERDRFFTAEQALEYGLIDRVLDSSTEGPPHRGGGPERPVRSRRCRG